MRPTKLEIVAQKEMQKFSDPTDKKEKQKLLDQLTPTILQQLTAEDLEQHTQSVYDDTVKEYENNPHNSQIIDELIVFMNLLPNHASVISLGCGTGRDELFMATQNNGFRYELMHRVTDGKTTLQKFKIPTNTYHVIGIDNSQKMINLADQKTHDLAAAGIFIKNLEQGILAPTFINYNIILLNDLKLSPVDGIWSCTGAFTHTPEEYKATLMRNISQQLKPGGVLFLSYTARKPWEPYNKLLLSSTGQIKWFSHQNPRELIRLADLNGLRLKSMSFNDMRNPDGQIIKKDLFANQFFIKN